jgi:AraC-like DNA-binding protein
MTSSTRSILHSPVRFDRAGRFAAERDADFHSHPGTELVYVAEGACAITVQGGDFVQGEGRGLFILPAHIPHYQHSYGFVRTTYLIFAAVPNLFPEQPRFVQVDPADQLVRWMEDICDIYRQGRAGDLLDGLLAVVLQRIGELEDQKRSQKHWHPALERAVALLEMGEGPLLTLDELATRSSISASHLCALFQQQLGDSPMKYQQQLRLQRAARQLGNPYARVQEVAEECGYEDVNYFVRLFKRQYGLPPGQWRAAQSKTA